MRKLLARFFLPTGCDSMRLPAAFILICCASFLHADETSSQQKAAKPTARQLEFFEMKIRPVLIAECYECHAADSKTLQGELRLDTAEGSRHGGESGAAIVAGKPDESLLLLAMKYESFEMPPNKRLAPSVIADFEKWIRDGAVDPRTGKAATVSEPKTMDIDAGRKFWAFQPPQPADLPGVSNFAERIDRLVDVQLQEAGVARNSAADRRTLLRRLSYDLTGLPPSVDLETRFFDNELSVESLIDELLASDRYGERWTRLWLDVARYAEDQAHIVGNNKSLFFPNAWKYRNWIINALNDDMPYDRFLNLQLAADQLEPESDDNLVALGFIGVGPKYYRRNDPEVMADEWEDRVDVVMRGLQGLTVACARCHDHKYDPIPTEDYYALAGVFASTEMFNSPVTSETKKDGKGHAKNPDESLHIIRDSKPTDLAVMIRGDVNNKGDVVPRGFLQVAFEGDQHRFSNGSGRAELAACITNPQNPLTARVIVNRIWQQYFGRGIVGTPSNFGTLGERPTHPELLDDLAVGFVNNGWSLKWLHRQITTSQTYQQSSEGNEAAEVIDPENRLLWRMPRRRLSAESWRDSVLAVSGQLSDQIGGPSIRPDDPKENRRTIYSEVSRFQLNKLLSLFDFPDPNVHAASRMETTTPLQKLFLLNSPFMVARANAIAKSLDKEESTPETVAALFGRVLGRTPEADEQQKAVKFVSARKDGIEQLAQILISSNEFWFVD